jgi:hypothetical protein
VRAIGTRVGRHPAQAKRATFCRRAASGARRSTARNGDDGTIYAHGAATSQPMVPGFG